MVKKKSTPDRTAHPPKESGIETVFFQFEAESGPGMSVAGVEADLETSVFMISEDKKFPSDEYFVFYNRRNSPEGAISSLDDYRGNSN